jgi:hypothetical protein
VLFQEAGDTIALQKEFIAYLRGEEEEEEAKEVAREEKVIEPEIELAGAGKVHFDICFVVLLFVCLFLARISPFSQLDYSYKSIFNKT